MITLCVVQDEEQFKHKAVLGTGGGDYWWLVMHTKIPSLLPGQDITQEFPQMDGYFCLIILQICPNSMYCHDYSCLLKLPTLTQCNSGS